MNLPDLSRSLELRLAAMPELLTVERLCPVSIRVSYRGRSFGARKDGSVTITACDRSFEWDWSRYNSRAKLLLWGEAIRAKEGT